MANLIGLGMMVFIMLLMPGLVILWNKSRTKLRVACYILRGDLWLQPQLCELMYDYILFNGKGYELHPKLARLVGFPSGWPKFLQETIPAFLLNEDDGIPLDWINPPKRKISSTETGTNLDPNIYRLLVQEAGKTAEGATGKFNLKKALPFLLVAVGILGLLAMFYFKSQVAVEV